MRDMFFEELDKAVNKIIDENFDLYFDEKQINKLMVEWLRAKLAQDDPDGMRVSREWLTLIANELQSAVRREVRDIGAEISTILAR